MDERDTVFIGAPAAIDLGAGILVAEGVPPGDARTMAGCLVRADLRGVDTHGLLRLPIYVERLRRGLVNPAPDLAPRRVTPVAAHLDGQDGFGFVVATRAMEEAIAMAGGFGLGLVSVRRSTHFGMAASYLLQAVEAGFAAFVFTNAAPTMPPWGGRAAMFGTNPFAVGIPGGGEGDFILDMAPSVAARGKIRRAERLGQPIPEGHALDSEGRPTTDPTEALKGVVLPIGGAKGSGIAMMVDILSGVLSGAAYGGDVGDQYKVVDRPQDVGHFVLAMKPDLFLGMDEVRARMDTLAGRVHGAPRAEGFDEVRMPGEASARLEVRRRREGVPYRPVDLEPLLALARERGVAVPELAGRPPG